MVAVSGGCDSVAQVRGVEAAGVVRDGTSDTVVAAVYFDASCAELRSGGRFSSQPRALYVITVPLEVAESFDGPVAFIACGEPKETGTQCLDPRDNAIPADGPLPGASY